MTDAPFALPLMFEEGDGVFCVYEKDGKVPIYGGVIRDRAEYLIRAVNSYDKMRKALEKIGNDKPQSIPTALDGMASEYAKTIRKFQSLARAILKEIDNG